MDAVLCPLIVIATDCGTPARTMFRTAVRRRSPDSKRLFYLPGADQFAVVTIATQPSFTFGNSEPLQRGWVEGGGDSRVYDILPDGKRFIGVVPASGAAVGQINVVLNWFDELKQRVPIR